MLLQRLWHPLCLTFFVAILLAMPFIIYQLWSFIKPALYEKERSLALPLLLGSILLFYAGIAFAYFIVLPSILHFFFFHQCLPRNRRTHDRYQ